MGLTAEIELEIRRQLAAKMELVTDAGFVLPSPLFFADKADFFAVVSPLLTQKQIELTPAAFCAISLLKFEDSPSEGCMDEPLVRLTYGFYFFREIFSEREDESETPDDFLKLLLKSYNTFINSVLDARIQFLGLSPLAGDFPAGVDVKTNSMTQPEFNEEKAACRYIADAEGHSVDLQSVVEVLINPNE